MSVPLFELTSFQRDILYVTSGKSKPSGQEIKAEFNSAGGEVTHGRLYPNLDTLVKRGYLEQGSMDRRTNYYAITDQGTTALKNRRDWEAQYFDYQDV